MNLIVQEVGMPLGMHALGEGSLAPEKWDVERLNE